MKKTAVVTGANTGMGKETARELARRGFRVVMGCRDPVRGEAARSEIVADIGNADLVLMRLDLASLEAVRAFARELAGRVDRLDVLVNNAGVSVSRRALTADGFERTVGVNHLGPFLLTSLLLPMMRASAPARIVNVSSAAHKNARLSLTDLQMERGWGPFRAYANSKLLNALFTAELSRRIAGTGVTANCLHPGFVATEIFRDAGAARPVVKALGVLLAKSPARGAETAVYLASAAEAEGISGTYYADCRPAEPSRAAGDPGLAREVWRISEELTGARW